MTIYLAANYAANPQMRQVAETLRQEGHEPICEWIEGTHQGDDHQRWAFADLRDLDASEVLVLFTQDYEGSRVRGGKHVEFGCVEEVMGLTT